GDLAVDRQLTVVADGDWLYAYRPTPGPPWRAEAMIDVLRRFAAPSASRAGRGRTRARRPHTCTARSEPATARPPCLDCRGPSGGRPEPPGTHATAPKACP